MKRISVLAAAVALLYLLPGSAAGAAESALVLTPDSGMVGDTVRGEQAVSDCPTYRLHWRDPAGLVLGTDNGSDGRGSVSFRVPDGAGTTQTVVATCQAAPGAGEQIVGGATFAVATAGTSTTRTTVLASTTTVAGATTTTGVPVTVPSTSTTVRSLPSSRPTATTARTATTRTPPPSGPTTAAPPTSTTIGRRPDVVACEQRAADAKAQLVYQPARRMTVGYPYEVVVSLALDASDLPAVVIPGPDRTTVVQLRPVECRIEAQLTGGADFTVTPPNPDERSFLHDRVLTWRWQVSPNRTGRDMRLLLQIKPIVVEDGRPPLAGSVDVHEALIRVDARPESLVVKVDHGVNGVFDNPLAKFLLIPGGSGIVSVWVSRRVRRRTSPSSAES
jgi:hypothetical protein